MKMFRKINFTQKYRKFLFILIPLSISVLCGSEGRIFSEKMPGKRKQYESINFCFFLASLRRCFVKYWKSVSGRGLCMRLKTRKTVKFFLLS